MIKINLAKMKQSTLVHADALSNKTLVDRIKDVDLEELAELPLVPIFTFIFIFLGSYFGLDLYQQAKIQEVEQKIQVEINQQAEMNQKLQAYKKYEDEKKQFDQTEKSLKEKLQALQTLLDGRRDPARILVSLSNSTPSEVWITELRLDQTKLEMNGAAFDFSQISELLRKLDQTAFVASRFEKMSLLGTELKRQGTETTNTANFKIEAKRKASSSASASKQKTGGQ